MKTRANGKRGCERFYKSVKRQPGMPPLTLTHRIHMRGRASRPGRRMCDVMGLLDVGIIFPELADGCEV